ncbi:hypothetical protein TRFO_09898 [Tritrichomonas foetus]|uniref:Uncharacterized protein n=1 Tax=Tritrichomonas foetus TaxID=1144522 RepID=A0A1J4JFU6_9EUKA|nr:hypothetical protein TRFO_09898 [Tritrichomonas foetus]|eukprot:OHS96515.1 hypothetical protein TRFO_09898 [Tritrichomonas foetus]
MESFSCFVKIAKSRTKTAFINGQMSAQRGPPNLQEILQKRKYNPSTEFPEDLKADIVLCDSLETEDEFRDRLSRFPLKDDFPPFDFGYDPKTLFASKEDKKAMTKASKQAILAYTEEMSNRKTRKKHFQEIYTEIEEKRKEELQSITDSQSLTKAKDEKAKQDAKNSLKNSMQQFDSDYEESYDDDDSSSSDQITDSSSDDDTERRVVTSSKSKPKSKPQTKKTEVQKKSKPSFDLDYDKNVKLIFEGKIKQLTVIEETFNHEKDRLEELERLYQEQPTDDLESSIKEQNDKILELKKIIKSLSQFPVSPSMAPKSENSGEKSMQNDKYIKMLQKAQKEVEQGKKQLVPKEEIKTASQKRSIIDDDLKADDILLNVSDDDDGDDDF